MTTPVPGPAELIQRFVADRGHYYGFLRLLSGDDLVAEELFQELSLAVIEGVGRFRSDGDLGKWVRGIARNLWRKHRARRHRDARVVPLLDERIAERLTAVYDERDAAEEEAQVAAARHLGRCLEALGERQRTLLAARYHQRRSSQDIAAERGMTPASVDSTLYRLRGLLLDCIRRSGGLPA